MILQFSNINFIFTSKIFKREKESLWFKRWYLNEIFVFNSKWRYTTSTILQIIVFCRLTGEVEKLIGHSRLYNPTLPNSRDRISACARHPILLLRSYTINYGRQCFTRRLSYVLFFFFYRIYLYQYNHTCNDGLRETVWIWKINI